ncbi:hypothetical protein AKJ16_DCAP06214 [Drosera capensis]
MANSGIITGNGDGSIDGRRFGEVRGVGESEVVVVVAMREKSSEKEDEESDNGDGAERRRRRRWSSGEVDLGERRSGSRRGGALRGWRWLQTLRVSEKLELPTILKLSFYSKRRAACNPGADCL